MIASISIDYNLDGNLYTATTTARRRAVLHNLLESAVDEKDLSVNPLDQVRWRAPRGSEAVDPRSGANQKQARALLDALAVIPGGQRFKAFFGAMYYSALRPSEVMALDTDVGGVGNESGKRAARHLKHRAVGDVRKAPCPPPLVELLKKHLVQFPPSTDGLLRD